MCSDHGFQPIRHNIHPNVLLRKLGLLEVQEGKPAKQVAYCLSQGGASAVYVLDQGGREQILKQLQEGLAGIEGVEVVLDARQFAKLGQPTPAQDSRGADLWLAAKYGYCFDDDPFIRSDDPTCVFSAWTYAKERCPEICRVASADGAAGSCSP